MKKKKLFNLTLILLICVGAAFLAACGGGNDPEARKLFPVRKNGKWGYINNQGKIVIEPQFDKVADFYEGLAQVEKLRDSSRTGTIPMEDVNCGYIDETGKFVVEPKYHSGISNDRRFSEGVAVFPASWFTPAGEVSIAPEKTIAIDKTGKVLFELDSNHKTEGVFSDGLLLVKIKEPQETWDRRKGTKFKYGYVDKSGKFVIEPKEWFSAEPFREGLASVALYITPPKGYGGDVFYGFIDTQGKTVIETKYKKTGSFHEGVAWATKDEKEYGFIDKDENWVGGSGYAAVSDYHDGMVRLPMSTFYKYRGKTLDEFISGDGASLTDFSEGLAIVLDNKNKMQIIDKKGEIVAAVDETIAAELANYLDAEGFKGGLARIASDKEIIYFDKKGKIVWREKTSV